MRTVLEDFPETLDSEAINLLEASKNPLGLKIGNHALIRRVCDGTKGAGHGWYWTQPFGGRWYECSQWWKDDHPHNARRLSAWVEALVDGMEDAGARGRLLEILDRLSIHGERPGLTMRRRRSRRRRPRARACRWCGRWTAATRRRRWRRPKAPGRSANLKADPGTGIPESAAPLYLSRHVQCSGIVLWLW